MNSKVGAASFRHRGRTSPNRLVVEALEIDGAEFLQLVEA